MTLPATSSRTEQHRRAPAIRWRHLITPPAGGAWNMALDEALLHRARETAEAVLRVYTWSAPTLSLGRNQHAAGVYDLNRAKALGVEFVRRPTGGRAVLHHREITYSVTAPVSETTLRESYEHINRMLVGALRTLGVDVSVAGSTDRAPLPDGSPCFEVPTVGELTFGGRKLVGSAQWREEGALLQHGSILVDDDQPLIAELSRTRPPPSVPPATLREALGRAPSGDEIARALVGAVSELEDDRSGSLVPDAELIGRARALETRYRSEEWTWRR